MKFNVGQRVMVVDVYDPAYGDTGVVKRQWWDFDGWRYSVEFDNSEVVDYFDYELSEVITQDVD